MADYLAQYTDQQVEEFAKKISKVYAQAAKEIQEKYDDYAAKYAVKDQKKFADYLAGKITLEKYQSWLKGQVFIGKQWEQKVKDITNVYLNADKKAYELLSDTDESVFTEAANHSAYEIEQGVDGAISFDLFDKETVKRLIKDNPKMLPEWKIDQPKDYIWNEERVQNAVAQAIIQGEKIPDIAKRLGKELATSNAKKMVLFARTATNGAQNAGRIQRMHETANMGLDVRKEWIAASDSRVRDTHRELNGQICKEGEKFKVGTQEIEYPGDPTAAPALVYNCRCSLGFVYPKYNKAEKGLYYIGEDGQKHEVTDMTYKEWTAAKKKETDKNEQTVVNGKDISGTWQRRPDKFDFEIEDVINAQGFDGKPRIVDADEFDKLVKEANNGQGFVAQRTYSAPTQEILDAYRDQLYNGKWYVDCSTGGAQYGQGMYCAADYTGTITDGMQEEMTHYIELQDTRLGYSSGQRIAEVQAQYAKEQRDKILDTITDEREKAVLHYDFTRTATPEERKLVRTLSDDEYDKLWNKVKPISELADKKYNEIRMLPKDKITEMFNIDNHAPHYVETITLDPSAKIIDHETLRGMMDGPAHLYSRFDDEGSLAAALGYDAINAGGHGKSGSYTVILNRTKVIFRRETK